MKTMDQPRASLQALVACVFNSSGPLEGITYGELAFRIGRLNKHGKGHGHGMGKVLEKMGHMLESVEDEWGHPIPHIQSLVVSADPRKKGLPSDGISEFWPTYPSLTQKEKANRTQAEYAKVRDFGSRWNNILSLLDIPKIDKRESNSKKDRTNSFGGGGESEQHLALKNYVATNPQLVGAEPNSRSFTEFALPSLDTIDVLFKGPSEWVAVEVKSRISDYHNWDYERGLYQCIKYQAILEAMRYAQYDNIPEIRVILLLESNLPNQYRPLAESLHTQVIENVQIRNSTP